MKNIFISYSHKDENWKNRLVTHLRELERSGYFKLWHDREIPLGNQWPEEIKNALDTADVAILMISPDFLDSDFIRNKEMSRIKERREKEKITVIPFFVRPANWKMIPWLADIQGFPKDAAPLSKMNESDIDEVLVELTQKLLTLVSIGTDVSTGAGSPGRAKQKVLAPPFSKGGKTILLTPLPKWSIHLLGRQEVLKELQAKLHQADRVLLINGMGGIGKTEVCKRFFLDHCGEFSHAAWVDCGPGLKEAMVNALGREDSKLIDTSPEDSLEDRFERVKNALYGLGEEALLVVDNIEDPEDEGLDTLLRLPFKVIANSRSVLKGFETFPLDVLSTRCCMELFYEHYQGDKDDGYVEKMIDLCQRHTLTVELLARTAWNANLKVKDLYDTLIKEGFNLGGVIPERVDTVWHDEKKQKQFFNHLLTVFDLAHVTGEELAVLTNLSVLPADVPMDDFCEWMELKSKDVINGLVRKGWLKREGGMLFMHNVIQEVVRHRATPDVGKCARVIDSIGDKLNLEPHENPITRQPYLRFGESLVQFIGMDERNKEGNNELAGLANNLSGIYWDLGSLSKALKFLLKTVEIGEKVLDKNHPDLARSYNNLSMIYQDIGDLEKALEFQLKALDIREQVLDKNHPELAHSYNNLSGIYQAMGDLEKALEIQLKAVEIGEEILDKNHPELAISYNNLSSIYKNMGDLEMALEFQLKALGIREQVLDKNHPSLATSYNNLSLIYQAMGDLEKALEFQLKALEIQEEVLYKNHPAIALSYSNLSAIYQDMGDLEKALEFQLIALEIREKVLGKNHPDLALSYNNLSMIYRDMGDLEKALEFQLKVLKIQEGVLELNHPDLALSYNNLSMIYRDMGDLEKTLEFQLKALGISEEVLDKNHPNLALYYNNLSMIYRDMGDLEKALGFQLKALGIRDEVLGKNHPAIAQSCNNLAVIYLDMKKYRKALTYEEKAVAILQHLFPNGHPNLDKFKKNLELIKKKIK